MHTTNEYHCNFNLVNKITYVVVTTVISVHGLQGIVFENYACLVDNFKK